MLNWDQSSLWLEERESKEGVEALSKYIVEGKPQTSTDEIHDGMVQSWGEGGTPIYLLYRYVLPSRVWFLSFLSGFIISFKLSYTWFTFWPQEEKSGCDVMDSKFNYWSIFSDSIYNSFIVVLKELSWMSYIGCTITLQSWIGYICFSLFVLNMVWTSKIFLS